MVCSLYNSGSVTGYPVPNIAYPVPVTGYPVTRISGRIPAGFENFFTGFIRIRPDMENHIRSISNAYHLLGCGSNDCLILILSRGDTLPVASRYSNDDRRPKEGGVERPECRTHERTRRTRDIPDFQPLPLKRFLHRDATGLECDPAL